TRDSVKDVLDVPVQLARVLSWTGSPISDRALLDRLTSNRLAEDRRLLWLRALSHAAGLRAFTPEIWLAQHRSRTTCPGALTSDGLFSSADEKSAINGLLDSLEGTENDQTVAVKEFLLAIKVDPTNLVRDALRGAGIPVELWRGLEAVGRKWAGP